MNPILLLRRGEGRFWGGLKRLARKIVQLHVPVGPLSRPFFRVLYCVHVGVREGGLWLLRFLWFEPLFRSQCAAVGTAFRMEQLPFIMGQGTIVIGDHVSLAGKSSFVFGNRFKDSPQVVIGDHSCVGHNCLLAVADSVRIGRYCLLAGGVSIADYDGHPTDPILRRTEPSPPEAIRPVVVGDDVWIGADAKILKGVTIGDRSIVGAGAVVTKSVPPDVIVAGNPARVVKSLGKLGMERNGHSLSQTSGRER